jgi:hypothetical protein
MNTILADDMGKIQEPKLVPESFSEELLMKGQNWLPIMSLPGEGVDK